VTGQASRGGATLGVVIAASVLAACGSSNEPGLSSSQAASLRDYLADARGAAAEGNPESASTALRAFREEVTELAGEAALDRADADRLREGAEQAEARVAAELTTAPEASQQAPPRAVSPPSGEGTGGGQAPEGAGDGQEGSTGEGTPQEDGGGEAQQGGGGEEDEEEQEGEEGD
jgi:hypothetical protein